MWIKLHRTIFEHWISKDAEKLKRWLILISNVNYKPSKFSVGNKLYEVPVGGSCKSIRTWSNLFDCGTKATINFFELLESDGMITRKTIGKGKHSTTLIVISNYNNYQGDKETLTTTLTDTQAQREGHTEEESKELKEVKKYNFKTSLLKYGFKKDLVEDWLKVRKTKRASNTETAFNKFIKQVEATGKDKNEVLEICVEKSWSGFQADWLNNLNNKSNGHSENSNRSARTTHIKEVDEFDY